MQRGPVSTEDAKVCDVGCAVKIEIPGVPLHVSSVEVRTEDAKICHVYDPVEVRVTWRCSNQHQANVTCVVVDRCQRQIRCNLYAVNGVKLTITRAGCDDRELVAMIGREVTKQFNVQLTINGRITVNQQLVGCFAQFNLRGGGGAKNHVAAEGYGAGAVARSQVTFKIDGAVTGVGTCATGLASLIPEPETATIFAMVLICTVRRRRAFN